jgi:hypothetical protein
MAHKVLLSRICKELSGVQWLMIHKGEFGRPGVQKVSETLISTYKLSMVVHTCDLSYVGGTGKRIAVGHLPQAKTEDPI